MWGLITAMAMATSPYKPDCGGNTGEIGACFAEAVARAEAKMEHYHLAALERVRNEDHAILPHVGVSAAVHMEWAQAEFLDFRNAECDAVYQHFAEGSIRAIESLACSLQMTNARTHDIWRRWLTYPDSTPPLLPEPAPVVAE